MQSSRNKGPERFFAISFVEWRATTRKGSNIIVASCKDALHHFPHFVDVIAASDGGNGAHRFIHYAVFMSGLGGEMKGYWDIESLKSMHSVIIDGTLRLALAHETLDTVN